MTRTQSALVLLPSTLLSAAAWLAASARLTEPRPLSHAEMWLLVALWLLCGISILMDALPLLRERSASLPRRVGMPIVLCGPLAALVLWPPLVVFRRRTDS